MHYVGYKPDGTGSYNPDNSGQYVHVTGPNGSGPVPGGEYVHVTGPSGGHGIYILTITSFIIIINDK